MERVRRFLSQPSKPYRNFQVVYGLLGLHFFAAGLVYLFFPDRAVNAFVRLGSVLGGDYYPLYERSYLWRILGASNVLTLGYLCVFIQADAERHWPAVYPLLFLKASTALFYFGVYAFTLHYPAFLIVASWDILNCAAILFFGQKGRDAALAGGELVPAPAGRL